jgi:hypothetical protein
MFNRHQQGMILLELLLTLALSGFLLLFITKFFTSAEESIAQINGRTLLQYHGVLALSLLRQESQRAGSLGCKAPMLLTTDHVTPQTVIQIHVKQSQGLPMSIRQSMKSQTMALETRHISPETAVVLALQQQGHQLVIDQSLSVNVEDRLIISNCEQAMEFIVQKVSSTKQNKWVTTLSDLSSYGAGAHVGFYEDHFFYIASASYHNQRRQSVYSLFEKMNQQPAQEVIAGVDDLQLRLHSKQQSGQLPLLEVSLVNDSIESIGLKKTPYYLQGILQRPADEKYYQAWQGWFAIGVAG